MDREYRGWSLNWDSRREVWVASQAGVEMNTTHQEVLKRMIDHKIAERVNRNRGPGGWIPE